MTTLKNYTGDEIAAALAEQLKDEDFVGLYRKAADAWWAKGPTAAAYKREIDAAQSADQVTAVRNKYLAAGSPLAGKLGAEGIDDFTPLIEYADDKAVQFEYAAEDGQAAVDQTPKPKVELFESGDPRAIAPEMTEEEVAKMTSKPADDSCPAEAAYDHGSLSIAAVNFVNRHLAKIATALDVAGFAGMANEIDDLMGKFAAKKKKKEEKEEEEEHGEETKGKKKRKRKGGKEEKEEKEEKEQDAKDGKKYRGRSYSEWVKHFNAHGKSTGEKFRKTFKGALEHAKKKKELSGDKAEEYAMRTALDKMPKSYFKEPTKVHGPGKSGPKVTKKKK